MNHRGPHHIAQLCPWLLLGLIGCSDPSPPPADVRDQERLVQAGDQIQALQPPTAPASARVVLAADGLVIRGRGVSEQRIAFGDPAARAASAVSAVYGKPKQVETLEDCGAGPLQITRFERLSLAAQDQKFVGWAVDGRDKSPLPVTGRGIGIGSTRLSLERAYPTETFESSLGLEFASGGLNGLLSGATPASPITNLWAGANCIMR